MALQQLPVINAEIQVIHTGPTDGASFSTTLDASDGGPIAPQQSFTFDLNVFAPDLIGTTPQVEVYHTGTGERVEVDATVTAGSVALTFFEPVTPINYRVKVMG